MENIIFGYLRLKDENAKKKKNFYIKTKINNNNNNNKRLKLKYQQSRKSNYNFQQKKRRLIDDKLDHHKRHALHNKKRTRRCFQKHDEIVFFDATRWRYTTRK